MWSGGTTHCARDGGASCAKRCHPRSQTGCMATASHCSCTLTTVVWHHPNLAHYPVLNRRLLSRCTPREFDTTSDCYRRKKKLLILVGRRMARILKSVPFGAGVTF